MSEVLQTSQTDSQSADASPLGEMGGHGISYNDRNGFSRSFEEHGYVIGIISVMPKTGYMNGLRRHFYKDDKYDYFWPDFAHLGEQPVYESELWPGS